MPCFCNCNNRRVINTCFYIYVTAFLHFSLTEVCRHRCPSIKMTIELIVIINITHNDEEHPSYHSSYHQLFYRSFHQFHHRSYLTNHVYFFEKSTEILMLRENVTNLSPLVVFIVTLHVNSVCYVTIYYSLLIFRIT